MKTSKMFLIPYKWNLTLIAQECGGWIALIMFIHTDMIGSIFCIICNGSNNKIELF